MSKFSVSMALLLAGVSTSVTAQPSAIIGPDATVCANGTGSAILVRVEGMKDRVGLVRVRTFGGDPSSYFDKKRALQRVELAAPTSGPVAICMKVPGPGTYAVDIRHDFNRDRKTSRSDGAGASGNPHVTLFDILFKRKPSPEKVAVRVGNGVVPINIRLKYFGGAPASSEKSAAR